LPGGGLSLIGHQHNGGTDGMQAPFSVLKARRAVCPIGERLADSRLSKMI
jgi:hypothetical protein